MLTGPNGLVELITESDCDLVLNAIVGSAGLVPTVATLGEGIDLALANKESLVVGGELVTALAEATGAAIIPVDSEHSALHQLLGGERRGHGRSADPHRLGRPVPRSHRRRARGRDGRAGARPSDLGDGRQDHDRLGDADEQGARADRGPPPVRDAVRADRRRRAPASRSSTASCSCATARRSPTSAIRTCGCRSPTRCITRSASTCRCGRSTSSSSARSPSRRPTSRRSRRLRLAREAGRAGGTAPVHAQRRQRGRRPRVPRRPAAFLDIAAVIEETLERSPPRAVHSFDALGEADARARRVAGELVADRAAA